MSVASKHFNAGVAEGRLLAARMINASSATNSQPVDPRERKLETDLRTSLIDLGVMNEDEQLPSGPDLDMRVGTRSGEFHHACFQIGSMLQLLRTHLKFASVGLQSIPDEALQTSNKSLVPLVERLQVLLDRVNAPRGAADYLQNVGAALADVSRWRTTADERLEKSDDILALLRAWLETVQVQSGQDQVSGIGGPRAAAPEPSRSAPTQPNAIFISYRRADTAHAAHRLNDCLRQRFGEASTFIDIDSISPGTNFVSALAEVVEKCRVVLAIIGPDWADRRLNDPDDFVRLEIEGALREGSILIPVLVDTTMPRADQLPPSLTPLIQRQAFELRLRSFSADCDKLSDHLATALAT